MGGGLKRVGESNLGTHILLTDSLAESEIIGLPAGMKGCGQELRSLCILGSM